MLTVESAVCTHMCSVYVCFRAGTKVQIHPPKLLLEVLPKLRSFVTNVSIHGNKALD